MSTTAPQARTLGENTMSASRTVAVLGPIPRDHIVTHNGETFDKYGCVLYTVAALSALMEPQDRICPIVHVRSQDEAAIKEQLSAFGNVDTTGIRVASDRGDVVELTYTAHNMRDERQTGFMSPIVPADVEFVLDADAFVCVPITDYEVGQHTLAYIKSHSDGVVLLDGHGPTVTLTRGGRRFNRLWVERDSWLPYIDILKMNLEEAGCSWFPDRESPNPGERPMSEADMPRFAHHCLSNGVKAVCITLDEKGSVVYYFDSNDDFHEEYVPRIDVADVVDTTGCGDSFMGTVLAGLASGMALSEAAELASYVSAYAATGYGAQASYGNAAQIREAFAK